MRNPTIIVIHVNAFTRKIECGYRMERGFKSSPYMTRAALLAYLVEHADVQVEFLNV